MLFDRFVTLQSPFEAPPPSLMRFYALERE